MKPEIGNKVILKSEAICTCIIVTLREDDFILNLVSFDYFTQKLQEPQKVTNITWKQHNCSLLLSTLNTEMTTTFPDISSSK